jgi:ankyrin repeat protein
MNFSRILNFIIQPNYNYNSEAFPDPKAKKFIQAVEKSNLKSAIELSKSLQDGLNTAGRSGQTALIIATERQNTTMVKGLLAAGANPNGGADCSIVGLAVRLDDLTILKTLLAAGADPNLPLHTMPPISIAARVGAHKAIDELLRHSARIDEPNSIGFTAALIASDTERWLTVNYLLDRGAKLSQWSPAGYTLGESAQISNLLSSHPEGRARDQFISRWRAGGLPWPAPNNDQVKTMLDAGAWPPKQ